ncbi:unnamed protein product [Cuscuta campestris]|uniref:Reverse transcriptase domain-containing protein n=1 Tax=Cuscuta campestris TaxID=132261 RepID=A0A484LZY3_9ASTE|nr:unnamed protein product [Cuscuta campestris]
MKPSKAGNYAHLAHPPHTKTSTKSRTTFSANHAQGRAQEARIYSHSTHERGDIMHDTQAYVPSTEGDKEPEKKSFASFFKKNRSANKGMKLYKIENDSDEVFIPEEDTLTIQDIWGPCLVGCFTGRFPGLKAIQEMVDEWGVPCQFLPHHKGWIVFKLTTFEDKDSILVKEHKEINSKKLLLSIPQEDFMWNAKSFSTMPVWVKLLDVPMKYWAPRSLSHIASKLGTPLYTDGLTNSVASRFTNEPEDEEMDDKLKYKKVNFCRILMNMDLSVKPPVKVKVNVAGGSFIQHVEYEDMPHYCYQCECFGHNPFDCPVLQELNKRNLEEEDRAREEARIEALKATIMAEAKSELEKQHKDTGTKAGFIGEKKTGGGDTGKGKNGLNPIIDEPSPSYTNKNEEFITVGKGKLTNHPIKEGVQTRDGRMVVLWNPVFVNLTFLEIDKQFIHCNVDCLITQKTFALSFVYALYNVSVRRELWDKLSCIGNGNIPWAVMGDFNSVASSGERVNCNVQGSYYMKDLLYFRMMNDLMDAKATGLEFTWNKGSAQPFKFFNMWIKHGKFKQIVQDVWDTRVEGTRQFRICRKLKLLKQPLRNHNKLEFGHISSRATEARQLYTSTLKRMILDPNNPNLIAESEAIRKKASFLVDAERAYYQQKSKYDQGRTTTSGEQVIEEFIGYYTNLFGTTTPIQPVNWSVFGQGPRLSTSQGQQLLRKVEIAEVKEALQSIGRDKAPGPDGYTSAFFLENWDIVGDNLFVRLLMECVTTASFSLAINGKLHGFIKCKRGIRQGDPMAPTLFLFCVEYLSRLLGKMTSDRKFSFHSKCAKLKIHHIAFADDIMMFARGDLISVKVLADAIENFTLVSGLHISPHKSNIFLAGSIKDNRQSILNLVHFPEGKLPVRYLGLPLTSQRASERDFAPLISKVDENIRRWNTRTLSAAGRVELIRSVIQGIEGFWLQEYTSQCWTRLLRYVEISSGAANSSRDIWTWVPRSRDPYFFKKLALVRDLISQKCDSWSTLMNQEEGASSLGGGWATIGFSHAHPLDGHGDVSGLGRGCSMEVAFWKLSNPLLFLWNDMPPVFLLTGHEVWLGPLAWGWTWLHPVLWYLCLGFEGTLIASGLAQVDLPSGILYLPKVIL